jgi:hypothetical protein
MRLILEYDRNGDILEVSLNNRAPTIVRDFGDDVWVKVDAETGAWRGFIVLNLTKHQRPARLESTSAGISSCQLLRDWSCHQGRIKYALSVPSVRMARDRKSTAPATVRERERNL